MLRVRSEGRHGGGDGRGGDRPAPCRERAPGTRALSSARSVLAPAVFPCSAICITFMSLFSLFNQYIFRPVKIVYLWLELHTSSFFHHH